MSAVKHILVACDGSQGALKAARFAGDLARDCQARVSVVIVHHEDLLMPYAWGAGEWPAVPPNANLSMDEIRAKVEDAARDDELARTVEALGKLAKPAETVQCWGHPAEEICRWAADHEVDLIVMGSRGRSSFSALLLGSVSGAVASHATCPVTLAR